MKRIAMFSVHGYFDPVPRLGATDTGGQVVYVIDLAKAIAGTGVKVDIYTRQFEGGLREEPINDDVRVIRLPCGPDEFIRKEELFKYWDEFIDNLDGYMKENNLTYDVFHSHYWDAGYVAMKITEKLGGWFVHTSHSLGAWKRELFKDVEGAEEMFRFEERVEQENIIFRAARGLTVTNQAGKDNYKRLYDFEAENMVMLPPGVDINLYYPLKDGEKDVETGLPEKYILALARIDHNKGFDLLIDAFATIAQKHPDFSLVIGGGSKNPVSIREHADITGCEIVLPREPEAVLLGSAILGAVAAGEFKTVLGAMAAMNSAGKTIQPTTGVSYRYHDTKHRVFRCMYDDFMSYRRLMES